MALKHTSYTMLVFRMGASSSAGKVSATRSVQHLCCAWYWLWGSQRDRFEHLCERPVGAPSNSSSIAMTRELSSTQSPASKIQCDIFGCWPLCCTITFSSGKTSRCCTHASRDIQKMWQTALTTSIGTATTKKCTLRSRKPKNSQHQQLVVCSSTLSFPRLLPSCPTASVSDSCHPACLPEAT